MWAACGLPSIAYGLQAARIMSQGFRLPPTHRMDYCLRGLPYFSHPPCWYDSSSPASYAKIASVLMQAVYFLGHEISGQY